MVIKKLSQVSALLMLFVATLVAQEILPPTSLSHRGKQGANTAGPAQSELITVPAETEVSVLVLSGIHTKVNRVDDPILARVLEPVYISGRIALPPGSLLDGRITMIRNAGHLRRPAELSLRFDRITLPDGEEEPIAAVLAALQNPTLLGLHLDAEGHVAGNRLSSWKGLVGGAAGFGGFTALKIAGVGSTGASLALPLGGAALIGYETLWRRGREVNMPPDTHCRLRLNYPLTLRVPW